MISKLAHYCKRVLQLGPRKTVRVVTHRVITRLNEYYWRRKAQQGTAARSWAIVSKRLDYHNNNYQFPSYSFINRLSCDIPDDEIIGSAHIYTQNGFDVLGSGLHYFNKIPWHTDFRLQAQCPDADYQFDKTLFYKDISIESGTHKTLHKDIKVPWELSRFQHLFVVGKAYQITKNKIYAQTFINHISDWLDENPFLFGVNWVCPMEVGLRAINWIIAFEFFKDAHNIPEFFWQRSICSVYDHYVYLEHNWEIFDSRTSNHYLSDLVAYLYLADFFKEADKFNWCRSEILKEWDKQVFDEGTDYEGSTKYHTLVTELFYHAYLLITERQIMLPDAFIKKLQRMFDFIEWITDHGGNQIAIGDNDSGTVLIFGLQTVMNAEDFIFQLGKQECNEVIHYNQAGLSIIKTRNNTMHAWHVTLRHHAYHHRQPVNK